MTCGKKSNNAPTEDFILASPAPVDVAAKISALFRELAVKVSNFCLLLASSVRNFRALLISRPVSSVG